MKSNLILSVAGICLGIYLGSGGTLLAQADIEQHKACVYCGMDRAQFAHSRMLVTFEDNTQTAVCSLHCAAIALVVDPDKTPKLIQVGDCDTKKLIEAEKAFWVLGGNKPGVMTKRGKWAFEQKTEADRFVKNYGGSRVTYEQAIKAAFQDMYDDVKMIWEKRKMRRTKSDHGH